MKATMDIRTKAVLFYTEDVKSAKEICSMYEISTRTLRRWTRAYESKGLEGIKPQKTGPKHAQHALLESIEQRILKLKQKHPSWGARRIKFQYDLPCHWKTVHNVIKRHKMLVRIKPKPQPCKRFQRKHVDSMWQGDSFQFRIHDVGKVYVTGFTDDRVEAELNWYSRERGYPLSYLVGNHLVKKLKDDLTEKYSSMDSVDIARTFHQNYLESGGGRKLRRRRF